MKISLKLLKLLRRYEDFLLQDFLLYFLDFLSFPCYKETVTSHIFTFNLLKTGCLTIA